MESTIDTQQQTTPRVPQAPCPVACLLRLHAQAQRLYRSEGAQTLAVLHHAALMRQHAPTAARVLFWDAVGRGVEEARP